MADKLIETLLQKATSIGPTEGGLPGYPPPLQEQGMPLPSFGLAGKLAKPAAGAVNMDKLAVDYWKNQGRLPRALKERVLTKISPNVAKGDIVELLKMKGLSQGIDSTKSLYHKFAPDWLPHSGDQLMDFMMGRKYSDAKPE